MNNNVPAKVKPRRQILRGLGIGESWSFPLTQMMSVRSDCYRYGMEWGKEFSSKTNREERVITVTRTA